MRSPYLMNRSDTALLVIDVQEKLVPKIQGREALVRNVRFLLEGAGLLGVPVLATEQYPKGLGPTLPELAEKLPPRSEKLDFSCAQVPGWVEGLKAKGIKKVLVCGIEAHVCVQQTALDLLASGLLVFLAADAVGSRFEEDRTMALKRLEQSGVVLTTSEAALFEWAGKAGTPEFKALSRLVVERDASRGA
ncbi:MAG TPA: hydrolase [bacterium]|nr:hydrolase [bacterium]